MYNLIKQSKLLDNITLTPHVLTIGVFEQILFCKLTQRKMHNTQRHMSLTAGAFGQVLLHTLTHPDTVIRHYMLTKAFIH